MTGRWHGTTIVGVKRDGAVAVAGDGQVTFGDVVMKQGARKVRRLAGGGVIAGFAGAVADALTLLEKFEEYLGQTRGDLRRAAVALAKEWRTERYLRRLEAQLIIADAEHLLLISGEGDVLEPDDAVVAIGSGGPFAAAAARALLTHSQLSAEEIARAAMKIAADLCIYTNDSIAVEVARQEDDDEAVDADPEPEPQPGSEPA